MPSASIPNPGDHAIVVGITTYPDFKGLKPLQGPVNDALDVRAWLLDPEGGGLDPRNLQLLCSKPAPLSVLPEGTFEPDNAAIEKAFKAIVQSTKQNTGRRLYVYMSGHGFSKEAEKACLLTSDYSDDWPTNCSVTKWVNVLIYCKHFAECVLWFDACMENKLAIQEGLVQRKPCALDGAPPPHMLAYATSTGGKAHEYPIADAGGQFRGVFTWTLLQGLRKLGTVDAEELKQYIGKNMAAHVPESERKLPAFEVDPLIKVMPPSLPRNQLVFGCAPRQHPAVTFVRADQVTEIRICGRTPLVEVARLRPAAGLTTRLARGLYVAEVMDGAKHHGSRCFEINGSDEAVIDLAEPLERIGKPVVTADATQYSLSIETDNIAASVRVFDSDLDQVGKNTGRFKADLASGIYKIEVRHGANQGNVEQKIVVLDEPAAIRMKGPQVRSPSPIADSAFTHEFHLGAAAQLAALSAADGREGAAAVSMSGIAVLARYWTGNPPSVADGSRFPHPFNGLSLRSLRNEQIADFESDRTVKFDGHGPAKLDPVAWIKLPLTPGAYILRQTLPDGSLTDRSLIVSPGWVTEVHILRAVEDLEGDRPPRVRTMGGVRIAMSRPGSSTTTSSPVNLRVIEVAWQALTTGTALLRRPGDTQDDPGMPKTIEDILCKKFDNPIAGIIGGLLLIAGAEQAESNEQRKAWLAPLDDVVLNLRQLAGADHPDVMAISKWCPTLNLRSSGPLSAPPMLAGSWRAAAHSPDGHRALAGPVWNRIKAKVADPLFLAWSSNRKTRAVYEKQLQTALKTSTRSKKANPAQIARAFQMPVGEINRVIRRNQE